MVASADMKGLVCNGKDNTIFKIPERLNCQGGPSKLVRVKVEKENLVQYKSIAESLQVYKYTCSIKQNFFGTKTVTKKMEMEKLSLSQHRELLSSKACLGTGGQIVSDLGSPNYECDSKWLKEITIEKVYCRYNKGYVTKTHNGDTISNLGEITHCDYITGQCFDEQNRIFIRFTPNREETKNYIEIGTYNATTIQKHIIISELGMSFLTDKEVKFKPKGTLGSHS